MATGDAALAAGFDILTGNELANTLDTEENKGRDYTAAVKATADAALPKTDVIASGASASPGKVPRYDSGNRFEVGTPQSSFQVANKNYVDGRSASDPSRVSKAGDTMSGSLTIGSGAGLTVTGGLFVPNATPATSAYVSAYINGDGRLSKGTSSRRWKKYIRDARRAVGTLFAGRLREFQMRGSSDGVYHVGLVAEELLEVDQLARFVVLDGDGEPAGIEEIPLLLAMVYELHARLTALETEQNAHAGQL